VSAADGSVAPLTAAPVRTAITATAASTRPRRITRGSSKGGSNGGLAALAAKSELTEAAQQHSNPAAAAFSSTATALLNGGVNSSSYTAVLGNGNGSVASAGAANGCTTDSGLVSATSEFPFSFPFPVSSAAMPAGTVPTVAGASPMLNQMLMFAGQPAAAAGMAVVDSKPAVTAVTAAAVGPVSTAADTADERRQKRLERNRESARQSRRRKKQYLELLQEKVAQLVGQLDTLRTVHLDDASR
jgi:bZIP transcription factor